MAHRKDICECGHERENHNNRIIKPFYPELKYNCCLEEVDCPCTRFRLKTPFSKLRTIIKKS